MLQDEKGKISGPRTVIAGFGAGITESLLAVTPFESIKTSLYVGNWGMLTNDMLMITYCIESTAANQPVLS